MAHDATPLTRRFPVEPWWRKRGERWSVELDGVEVSLSHLDKVLWPDEGITKGDLVAYYLSIAPRLLPHLADRPLTLKRMPGGVGEEYFYQRDAPDHTPGWVPRCTVESEDSDPDEMIVAGSAAALAFTVNLGALEMHPLHARCGRSDPDYLVVDLDPFEPAGFEDALVVARHIRVVLDHLGLEGFPKTSGATGVHVYVPLAAGHTFEETRGVAEAIGRTVTEADPERVTMEWPVSRRSGKVFVDHLMNRRGASLASVYSVRPRPGAPVSTPLSWDEVESGEVRPEDFTIETIFSRPGDPFAPVLTGVQTLHDAVERLPGRERRR